MLTRNIFFRHFRKWGEAKIGYPKGSNGERVQKWEVFGLFFYDTPSKNCIFRMVALIARRSKYDFWIPDQTFFYMVLFRVFMVLVLKNFRVFYMVFLRVEKLQGFEHNKAIFCLILMVYYMVFLHGLLHGFYPEVQNPKKKSARSQRLVTFSSHLSSLDCKLTELGASGPRTTFK